MLDEYFTLRGWDVSTGRPTAETLHRLGLADAVERLNLP
jgi:aldehyde:ferredoxin oxidoreductase